MQKKKLIEVAMPVEAINAASQNENANPFLTGHPKSLKWWARRPLAACRAVVLASMLDDPSSEPDRFPDADSQERERARLLDLVARCCRWDLSAESEPIQEARAEVLRHTAGSPPVLCDPFAGGASIPLEAMLLGLPVVAADLNPVAVLINRALLQLAQRFPDGGGVHPTAGDQLVRPRGAAALAADLRHIGGEIADELAAGAGQYWPSHDGDKGSRVVAWIWARTVASPNPAWGGMVPLVRSFELASKGSVKTWVSPEIDRESGSIRYTVQSGKGPVPSGTVADGGAVCIATGTPITFDYIRSEGRAGRLGQELLAVVVDRGRGKKAYRTPTSLDSDAAAGVPDIGGPSSSLPERALGFRVQAYGLSSHRQLFTARQIFGLETIVELISARHSAIEELAQAAGMTDDQTPFARGGTGSRAYADAVVLLLGKALARTAMFHSSLCKWNKTNENVANPFALMTLSMTWDFAEGNLINSPTDFRAQVSKVAEILETAVTVDAPEPQVLQADARYIDQFVSDAMFSTDPPYYDNAGYADLSDYFYVWERRVLKSIFPDDCSTLLSPKDAELIASPDRHGGKKVEAKRYFEEGLQSAFGAIREASGNDFPFTVHYAFKQQETKGSSGAASTGWETMLEGLLGAGWCVVGTWPLRTEREARSRNQGSNALASSIVLVCRKRPESAPLATRKEFIALLRAELPEAIRALRAANVAPVDFAQSAIGPGMAVFSRFARVVEADGSAMRVRSALELINQALDEISSGFDAEFDADTRWAMTWFEDVGMAEGEYGRAEQLSKTRNTSVAGLAEAGVIFQRPGKVRLLRRDEMSSSWDPTSDRRLAVWEITQHLIRRLESEGENAAAALLRQVGGGYGELAKELSYRLFLICDRKGWPKEALAYNALVSVWSELTRLASSDRPQPPTPGQGTLL